MTGSVTGTDWFGSSSEVRILLYHPSTQRKNRRFARLYKLRGRENVGRRPRTRRYRGDQERFVCPRRGESARVPVSLSAPPLTQSRRRSQDDFDRENEGDFIGAASTATAASVALMLQHCTGVVCAPLLPDRAAELDLPLMVPANRDPFRTAFTVTVDVISGTTTGISATDRAATIRALATSTSPDDFSRPGHVFPLIARVGGVLVRDGHTEAGVDLCRLAGLPPVAFLCEICDHSNFEMLRLPEIIPLAARLRLPLTSIAELQRFRMRREPLLRRARSGVFHSLYGGGDNAYVVRIGSRLSAVPPSSSAIPVVVLFHAASGAGASADDLAVAATQISVDSGDVSAAAASDSCVTVHVFGPVATNVPGNKSKAHVAAATGTADFDAAAVLAGLYAPPAKLRATEGGSDSLAPRVVTRAARAGRALHVPDAVCDRVAAEIVQALTAALHGRPEGGAESRDIDDEFTRPMFQRIAAQAPGIEGVARDVIETPESALVEANASAWPRLALSVFALRSPEAAQTCVAHAALPRLWLFGAHVDEVDVCELYN